MNKKIKEVLLNKNIWFFTAITFIFFGMLIKMEFAADSYATLTFSLRELIGQFAPLGRFVLVIAFGITKILELKSETTYLLSYILAIVCMGISLYKLYNLIKPDVQSNIAKKITPILIILNAFSIELFLYIEKGIMVFAVLMSILAVCDIKKWLETKQKKYLITTFIFMLLANFSYQGVVGIFVAISLVYILKYSKNIKQFIVNNVVVALSYGIPAIIDYALIKILYSSGRVSGSIILSESIQKVFTNTQEMITSTYGILPEYFLMTFIILAILLLIYEIIKQKIDIKNKVIDILKVVYIIAGVIFATVAPQLMQNTNSIWFVARSTYTYAALFGILVLYMFMNYKINKEVKYVTVILSMVLLIVQFYRFNVVETDRYKVNAIDYEITRKIVNQIDEYEKETGNKITKLAVYGDKSLEFTYSGRFATGDINLKAYYKDWSINAIIQYYYGRDLKLIEPDTNIEENFKQKDWTTFENEQIILKGDTLHICRY